MDKDLEIGELVYLKTDCEQLQRMVTGIIIRPGGKFYYLSYGTQETQHYLIEISKDKNTLITLGVDKNKEEYE